MYPRILGALLQCVKQTMRIQSVCLGMECVERQVITSSDKLPQDVKLSERHVSEYCGLCVARVCEAKK